nr:C-C chemokine receptor type 2 isoform X3 [Rattus norvegicus]
MGEGKINMNKCHVSSAACKDQKRALDSPQVLGTELESSAKTVESKEMEDSNMLPQFIHGILSTSHSLFPRSIQELDEGATTPYDYDDGEPCHKTSVKQIGAWILPPLYSLNKLPCKNCLLGRQEPDVDRS